MKKQTIYRTIQTDSTDIQDIVLENLGCHWTKSPNYTHNGGSAAGLTETKKYRAQFTVEVSAKQINQAATELSNTEHPKEREVVLNQGVTLTATVILIENGTGRFVWGFRNSRTVEINTGTRVDQWVLNLK